MAQAFLMELDLARIQALAVQLAPVASWRVYSKVAWVMARRERVGWGRLDVSRAPFRTATGAIGRQCYWAAKPGVDAGAGCAGLCAVLA